MRASKIVKDHLQLLEHFIEQGGYPLKIAISNAQAKSMNLTSPSEAKELCKLVPALCLEEMIDGSLMLQRDKSHDWDYEIVAEFWKYRFKEEQKEANRLHSLIEKFKEMVG